MKHIDTVSKIVDETEKEAVTARQPSGVTLWRRSAPSSPLNGSLKGLTEVTLAVSDKKDDQKPIKKLDSATVQLITESKWKLHNQGNEPFIRKNRSEPSLTQSGLKKVLYYDNPVFNNTDDRGTVKHTSFAAVVTEIIQEPIKGDIHPFGRGPLYSKTLGGEQTKIHSEEGKLFMWALATVIVLSVAFGVIVMSQMYQAKQQRSSEWTAAGANSTH